MNAVRPRGLVLQLHAEVAALIDQGRYAPGAAVGIAEIARRFEVSSTPVREALARLAAEGRLEFVANHGYRVPMPPTARDYADWAAARIAVESSALLYAFGPIDPTLVEVAQRVNDQLRGAQLGSDLRSVLRYAELNRRFHEAIVAIARNPLLTDMQRRLYASDRFSRVFVGCGMPAKDQVVAEHQRIVDTLRAGDCVGSAEYLRTHIVDSLERDARIPAVSPALRRLVARRPGR